jgi:uncharacterized metal-binding protein YceD (DUF177 family)
MINLNELNYKKEILIDEDITFEETYSSIKSVDKCHFKGKVFIDSAEEAKLEGILNATLILYDSVDLSDYEYKIEVNIDEILSLEQKTLDINEILWENIVLEVPIRATKCENASQKGEGWEVKDNDSLDETDPRFAKLQELFKGGE